jgi:hypothetical protein
MTQRHRNDRGSVLVMAVMFAFISVLLGVTYLSFAVNLHDSVSGKIRDKKKLFNAYTGALKGVTDHISGIQQHGWKKFYTERNNQKNVDYIDYRIDNVYGNEIEYGTEKTVLITGLGWSHYDGLDGYAQVNVNFGYETYADYLYISHRERDTVRHDDIRFWTPDTLDGKVHSNDSIRVEEFFDRPVFKKRVTSSMTTYVDPPGNHARFDVGRRVLSRSAIHFPDQADILRDHAGLILATGSVDSLIQIVLDGNIIRWRRCGLRDINGFDSIACYPSTIAASNQAAIPSSGVIWVIGKLWVSASRGRGDIMDGEIPERRTTMPDAFISAGFNGQLTILASDTLIISDNVIYKYARPNFSVPTTMDTCSDVLGLVSEKFIMFHRQVRDSVYVNAALAAVAGSISVQDIYWYTYPGRRNAKVKLFIFGSLAQRNRGIVHTSFPCGEPDCERGFDNKDYHYDVRLSNFPPPFYLPTLDQEISFFESEQEMGGGGD